MVNGLRQAHPHLFWYLRIWGTSAATAVLLDLDVSWMMHTHNHNHTPQLTSRSATVPGLKRIFFFTPASEGGALFLKVTMEQKNGATSLPRRQACHNPSTLAAASQNVNCHMHITAPTSQYLAARCANRWRAVLAPTFLTAECLVRAMAPRLRLHLSTCCQNTWYTTCHAQTQRANTHQNHRHAFPLYTYILVLNCIPLMETLSLQDRLDRLCVCCCRWCCCCVW